MLNGGCRIIKKACSQIRAVILKIMKTIVTLVLKEETDHSD